MFLIVSWIFPKFTSSNRQTLKVVQEEISMKEHFPDAQGRHNKISWIKLQIPVLVEKSSTFTFYWNNFRES